VRLAYLPSPSQGVWHLGPLPIRAYALCIILGVIAAILIAERRWVARGGRAGTVGDIATWAVPMGLLGARVYNVVTDPELYFTKGMDPWNALRIWDGGLGIWGAIIFGAISAYVTCRRRGIAFWAFADAAAPGVAVAQAIGRFGNYFNQELYGRASGLPWAIRIDPAHRPTGTPNDAFYQPTFLYESLWDLGTAGLVIWADRRFSLGRGRAFALYVMTYCVGRGWIEALRVDHAHHFFGVRLNDWVALIVFLFALVCFLRNHGTRETSVDPSAVPPAGGTSPAESQPDDAIPVASVPAGSPPEQIPCDDDPATGPPDGAG
jgi:prolipoprotein diacylglyceryl transferase